MLFNCFQKICFILLFLASVSKSTSVLATEKQKNFYFNKNDNYYNTNSIRNYKTPYGQPEGFFLDEIEAVTRLDTLECPSSNVISTRYKCQVNDKWVDCYRKRCCQGYNFVAGKCLPDSVDPCSKNFCEQKCSIYFGRVICTCFSGFVFSPENRKKGISPVCLDINECEENRGGCDHFCVNIRGSFKCRCRPGYQLSEDKRTCNLLTDESALTSQIQPAKRDFNDVSDYRNFNNFRNTKDKKCYAPCSLVGSMERKIKKLEEKIVALSTAVRLYSFAAGPPGPQGPPGPLGPQGKRGFPGPAGPDGPQGPISTPLASPSCCKDQKSSSSGLSPNDFPLDSWTVIKGDEGRQFCKCRRGAVGPPGATGKDGLPGLRGDRGERGIRGEASPIDFLILMMADLRHDITNLQNKVYDGQKMPEQFDLDKAIKKNYSAFLDKSKFSQTQDLKEENLKEAKTIDPIIFLSRNKTDFNETLSSNITKSNDTILNNLNTTDIQIVNNDLEFNEFNLTEFQDDDYKEYETFIGFKYLKLNEKNKEQIKKVISNTVILNRFNEFQNTPIGIKKINNTFIDFLSTIFPENVSINNKTDF